MKHKQNGFTLVEGGGIFVIIFWLAMVGGWIANIVKFVGMIGPDPISSMFVARAVGIVMAPLGCILGYF